MGGDQERRWTAARRKILGFLFDYLERIEWRYGEGRAPFLYPCRFRRIRAGAEAGGFLCVLTPDVPDSRPLRIRAEDPETLVVRVVDAVEEFFGKGDAPE